MKGKAMNNEEIAVLTKMSKELTVNNYCETIKFESRSFIVVFEDGRKLEVPYKHYPRLMLATKEERESYGVCGNTIHWECIDEDIDTTHLLLGRKSQEALSSFAQWVIDHKKA